MTAPWTVSILRTWGAGMDADDAFKRKLPVRAAMSEDPLERLSRKMDVYYKRRLRTERFRFVRHVCDMKGQFGWQKGRRRSDAMAVKTLSLARRVWHRGVVTAE
jgi:hypothetical protein